MPSARLAVGDRIEPMDLHAAHGEIVTIPDARSLVHLQFRRFAGCPLCNLHLRAMLRRRGEIWNAGIREVVFFHGPADALDSYARALPFDLIADPAKRYYRRFGVTSGPQALLDPRVWPVLAGAVAEEVCMSMHGKHKPASRVDGGRFGLPAEFLIAPSGRVLAAHYGVHAYDQWDVDQLLMHARGHRRLPAAV